MFPRQVVTGPPITVVGLAAAAAVPATATKVAGLALTTTGGLYVMWRP